MLDKNALTARGLVWMSVLSLVVCVLLLSAAYLVMRVRTLTTVQAQIVQLEAEQRDLRGKHDVVVKEIDGRIGEIERTLFGDVVVKLEQPKAAPRPSAVELWQRNRDRELRDTLIGIQKRLMRIESLLQEDIP